MILQREGSPPQLYGQYFQPVISLGIPLLLPIILTQHAHQIFFLTSQNKRSYGNIMGAKEKMIIHFPLKKVRKQLNSVKIDIPMKFRMISWIIAKRALEIV
jgi:hypothetical protein